MTLTGNTVATDVLPTLASVTAVSSRVVVLSTSIPNVRILGFGFGSHTGFLIHLLVPSNSLVKWFKFLLDNEDPLVFPRRLFPLLLPIELLLLRR